MEDKMNNLVDTLYSAHLDNSRQQYYAKHISGSRTSIMPLTTFVFEFFLFNSLYQVDWKQSFVNGSVTHHPDDYNELRQQAEYTKFIKGCVRQNPAYLYRALEPLIHLPKAEGEWTKITPDARVSHENGERFFRKIRELQSILEDCSNPEAMPTTNKVFDLIDDARYFIYLVRNNIFHGSKSLGETNEPNQKRRIEVYDLFLKGMNSLFFLAVGKSPVASDLVPCPISAAALPGAQEWDVIDQNTVWTALNSRLMKPGDSRLIFQFTKYVTPPKDPPSERSALFYPSAGIDILTPLLLGLPYCRQFYFYEKRPRPSPPAIASILRQIPLVRIEPQQRTTGWTQKDNYQYFDFEFANTLRRIYWVGSDNMDFLSTKAELAFYFHRGDSWGEGGSGQQWDSRLLPQLMKKIPTGRQCIFLTDGEPGGISKHLLTSCGVINFPFIERSRRYYWGTLSNYEDNHP